MTQIASDDRGPMFPGDVSPSLPARPRDGWQARDLLRLLPAMAAEAAAVGLPALPIDLADLGLAPNAEFSAVGQIRLALTGGTPGASARAPWLVELVSGVEALGLRPSFVRSEGGKPQLMVSWDLSHFPELAEGESGRAKLFSRAMRMRIAAMDSEAPAAQEK